MTMRIALLLSAVLLVTAGCSGVADRDVSGLPTGKVTDPDSLAAMAETVKGGGEYVLHVEKGTSLPLLLEAELPFATLAAGENEIRFTREVWLLASNEAFLISPDGKRWASFGDFPDVKELFGVETGSLSLGLQATEAAGARLALSFEAK
jgi:hypothetical protein